MAAAAARPGRPGASGRGRRGRAGRGAGAGRTWPENSGDRLPSCGPAVPYRLGGLESLLEVRDLETRQTAQGQRKQKGRPEGQIQAEVERDTQSEIEGTIPRAENAVRESEQPKETESAQNSEFRGGKRERREPWAETRRGRDGSLGPPRRRHPQRTLRIRHGFASFGRYYFAPEKK